MTLPVLSDLGQLLRRLAVEERARLDELASLEDRIRRFEDVERPAYDRWRRLEFGPALVALEELCAELRERRLLAEHVMDLVDRGGLRPREALYVATNPVPIDDRAAQAAREQEEIAARRRAKLDRKRAARKQAARPRPAAASGSGPTARVATPARITGLYRALARRLHPDSPTVERTLDGARMRTIWVEVQAAYVSRDLDRLLAISAWLDAATAPEDGAIARRHGQPTAGPAGGGIVTLSERYARLRALSQSCRALARRRALLERAPEWDFERQRARRAFRDTVGRAVAVDLAGARAALAAVEEFLASIGSPQRPRSRGGQRFSR